MGLWRTKLIPRTTLQGYHMTTQMETGYNIPAEPTATPFDVEEATVHPIEGHDRSVLPEGYRDKLAFTIYTITPVFGGKEATNELSDRIEVEYMGETITTEVVSSREWKSGLLDHYRARVVELNER